MFYNISKIRSDVWPDNQIEAANRLGGPIVNIYFPHVPMKATSAECFKIAEDIFNLMRAGGENVPKLSGDDVVLVRGGRDADETVAYLLIEMLKHAEDIEVVTLVATPYLSEFVQFRDL